MNRVADLPSRSAISARDDATSRQRHVPVLNASVPSSDPSHSDPMDITLPTTAVTAPPPPSNADGDSVGHNANGSSEGTTAAHGQTIGAAAAAQQPKVVQTAFIHKLYRYGSRRIREDRPTS